MQGHTIGVFGTDKEQKALLENSVAKKSEVEGMIVYHRNEAGLRFSLLDDPVFPEKIQGYARIASISDYAYYLFPKSGKLTPPDGELAVLLDSLGLPGSIEVMDSSVPSEMVKASLKGLRLESYPIEQRSSQSSVIDLSRITDPPGQPPSGTLVYIDRAFSVKGVGTVVLGFVICGTVNVHDKLRAIPASPEKMVEVKGIQVNDEDQESVGRGVRVGLSLKGVDAKELDKASWLDDGSFKLTGKLSFEFRQTPYYRQGIEGRELHLQLPGELVTAKLSLSQGTTFTAALPQLIPFWERMRVCVIDLNGKNLRVAGGGLAKADL